MLKNGTLINLTFKQVFNAQRVHFSGNSQKVKEYTIVGKILH